MKWINWGISSVNSTSRIASESLAKGGIMYELWVFTLACFVFFVIIFGLTLAYELFHYVIRDVNRRRLRRYWRNLYKSSESLAKRRVV
jgi:hypothetical protein